jgi:L-asparaginase II
METISYQPVFETTRGILVESIQFGAFVLVNPQGQTVAGVGDPELVTYLRSSAKPFQALPFMQEHGDDFFGLSPQEVAIMCSSHIGTDEHVETVRSFQQKVGVREEQLLCGVHNPSHTPTWKRMIHEDEPLTPNRHNCSGKHTGMLAYARMKGYPQENYIDPNHPVQKMILKTFAEMVGLPEEQVIVGIDGCSVPTFAIPIKAAALGYARLCDPTGLPLERASACNRIVQAMTGNSRMIAGPERFDTLVMQIACGKVLSKMGAEGFQALGILPDAIEPGSPAMGVAIKISDGDETSRARPMGALEILRQMGVLSKAELDALKDFDRHPIYNFRHLQVGEYRTSFHIR